LQDTDVFVVQMLNGIGDLIDLQHVLQTTERPDFMKMTNRQLRHFVASSGHCSALIKVNIHMCSFHLIILAMPHMLLIQHWKCVIPAL
jgi:Phospholipase B